MSDERLASQLPESGIASEQVKVTRRPALLLDPKYVAVKREDLERWRDIMRAFARCESIQERAVIIMSAQRIESYLEGSK